MGRPERFEQLGKDKLDFYLERAVAKDNDLENDITKLCSKLADTIIETDGFVFKEVSVIKGRVQAVEIAKYLSQRMHKDTLRLTNLMISRRETELSRIDKEKFADKFKGSLPF